MPNWDSIVATAVAAAAASGLGYTGVDVVLAEGNTPMVLEVNVRPGLGIQNATGDGLFRRLSFIEALPAEYEYLPAAEKIALARQWDAAGYDEAARPGVEGLRAPSGPESTRAEPAAATPTEPTETTDAAHGRAGRDDSRPRRTDVRSDALGANVDTWRRLATVGGASTGAALLAGALVAGFPAVAALFVLVAVGFVGWLCWQAFGPHDPGGGERE
jgi:hypothetical protein